MLVFALIALPNSRVDKVRVAYIIQREEQRKQGNTFGFKI
jgi:hypothetical protein